MNIFVQGKYVKDRREKNSNPLVTWDVLSKRKTKKPGRKNLFVAH